MRSLDRITKQRECKVGVESCVDCGIAVDSAVDGRWLCIVMKIMRVTLWISQEREAKSYKNFSQQKKASWSWSNHIICVIISGITKSLHFCSLTIWPPTTMIIISKLPIFILGYFFTCYFFRNFFLLYQVKQLSSLMQRKCPHEVLF